MVIASVDHDVGMRALGRTDLGTLVLETDELGLKVTIYPPEQEYAHSIIKLIEKDKADMTFGWVTKNSTWRGVADAGPEAYVQDLIEVDLLCVVVLSRLLGNRR